VAQLTILIGLVALSGDAARDCLDEARVGADAFGVKVAGTGDRVEGAVLLARRDECQPVLLASQWPGTKLTAHMGKELKLCAEANAASRAVTTTVRGDMANFLAIVDCERRIDVTLDDRVRGQRIFNGPASGPL
jgi:hypothetical protein